MKKNSIIVSLIVLAAFAISTYFYPQLPDKVASHWNTKGEVDGYMPRFWGTFLLPFVMAAMALLFVFIPKIDPLKANIQKFQKYYGGFTVVFSAFFLLVHLQVLLWSVGVRINPAETMPVGLGVLFFYVGILCEHTERN